MTLLQRRLKLLLKLPNILLPFLVWTVWVLLMASGERWHLFADNWFMSVTMAVGSFIAGSTSEGGGAVAFPVMTLLFKIEPSVARDFSLMIQSVGMTAAAIAIWQNRIAIETRAIVWAGLGGAVGIVLGLEVVAPYIPPVATKLFFVSLWLSFGIALLWLGRNSAKYERRGGRRLVWQQIPNFKRRDAVALIAMGTIGGMVSGITGSGLDILTFSLLVLVFRVDEKVATPTSVVLMATNSLIGFWWKLQFSANPIASDTWNYWWVSIPVVVIGAPLGARFIATRSSLFVVRLLLSSIVIQFVTALLILPLNLNLMAFSLVALVVGCTSFLGMILAGDRRSSSYRDRGKKLQLQSEVEKTV